MLYVFALFACVSAIGLQVDIGAESLRASSLVRGKPVSIVLNPEGRRFTPAVAAILGDGILDEDTMDQFQRVLGNINLVQRHPKNSIRFLPQLLGKNYTKKLASYLSKRNLTMGLDEDEENYIECVAKPEFYAAQMLERTILDIRGPKVNLTVDPISIVVPKFFTHHQRKALIHSGKLINRKVDLINSTAAVGHLFALERSTIFKENPLIVMFIDIGASQIQCYIQEFTKTKQGVKINEFGYSFRDDIGSYAMDAAIALEIRKAFEKKYPNAVIDERAVQRLVAAGRNVKHELTLQSRVSLYLEDITPGNDIEFQFSREDLKNIFSKELGLIKKTIIECLNNALFDDPEDIERIELIGGGTRSPVIMDLINETFQGKVPILRSLNPEEANVIGAGYVAAAARRDYLATNLTFIDDAKVYNISARRHGRLTTFAYGKERLPIGIPRFISTVEIGQTGSYTIENGVVKVKGARKLTQSGLYREKRFAVERLLQSFNERENATRERQRRAHEFESFLAEARDNLTRDPDVVLTSTEDERIRVLEMIAQAQYTAREEGIEDERELKRMQAEINDEVGYLMKRAEDKRERPGAIKKLRDTIDEIENAVLEEWPSMGVRAHKKDQAKLGRMMTRADNFCKEVEDGGDAPTDDIIIMTEKLRREFDWLKERLIVTGDAASDL